MRLILIPPALLVGALSIHAAPLTWDADPATAGVQDGAGTWDVASTNWWDGAANTNWTDATPDSAVIGASNGIAGPISLSGTRTASGLRFAPPGSGSYSLTNGALILGAGGLATSPFADPGKPLDVVSTSALAQVLSACSLRQVIGSYAGPAISVRRTSDNATQDVFFTSSGLLDTAALLTFVGAADGVVERVYPQAGTVVVARVRGSPRIVIGGVLQTWPNGLPRIVQGSGDGLRTSGLTNLFAAGGATVFYSLSKDTLSGGRTLTGTSGNWLAFHWSTGEGDLFFNSNPNSLPTGNLTMDLKVWSLAADSNSVQVYRNGSQYSTFNTPSLTSPGELDMNGVGAYSEPSSSSFGELLIFGAKLGAADLAVVHRSQMYYHTADTSGAGQQVALFMPVTLSAAQGWTVINGATVTAEGAVDNGGNLLSIKSWGSAAINGALSGTGGLWKGGGGTLVLGGAAPNTFSGMLTVGDYGKIILAKPAGVNAVGGDIVVAPYTGWGAGAPTGLELANDEQIPNTAVLHFTGVDWCSFRPRGHTETIAGLDSPGGKGVIENNGWNGGGPAATGVVVLETPAGSNFFYSGYVRDYDGGGTVSKISLVKNGSGTQILSGVYITYTGPTRVNQGTLMYRDAACASPISNEATVVLSGIANGYSRIAAPISGAGAWLIDGSGAGTVWQNRGGFGTSAGAAGVATNAIVVSATGKLWLEAATGQNPCWGPTQPVDLTASSSALYVYGNAGLQIPVGSLRGAGLVDFYDGGAGKSLTLSIGGDNSSQTFGGSIRNSGASSGPTTLALTKIGTGTQVLSAASTYSGATTISAGVLALAASGSISNSTLISVSAGAVLDATAAGLLALGPSQGLGGGGTVLGSVVAQAGSRLVPGAAAVGGPVGTLSITGNVALHASSTNTFNLGASTNAGGAYNDLIAIVGDLEPSNSVVAVEPLQALSSGTYRLFTYTGSKTTLFNPAPAIPGGLGRQGAHVDDTSTVGQVNLVVTGSVGNLVWLPQASANWNGSEANWSNPATAALDLFLSQDAVVFNEAGAYSNTVTIPATPTPSWITVSGASNYIFAGAGGIAGAAGLTKSGSGVLLVLNTNTYFGATIISNGTLLLRAGGLPNSPIEIGAGATLASDTASAPVTLPSVISGAGSLIATNSANWTYLTADNTYAGGTYVANPGSLLLGNNSAAGSVQGAITNAGTLGIYRSNACLFTNNVTGSGTLNLYQPGGNTLTIGGSCVISQASMNVVAGTFSNSTAVFSGDIRLIGAGQLTIADGAAVTVGGHAWLAAQNSGATATTTIRGGSLTVLGPATDARDSYFSVLQSGGQAAVGALYANQTEAGNSGGFNGNSTYTLTGGRLTAGAISGGAGGSFDRGITLNLGGGTLKASQSFTMNANTVNLTGGGDQVTLDTDAFTLGSNYPFTGPGGFSKIGSGILLLTAVNTYGGPTVVSNGLLQVQGSLATGRVTVASGGTLGGAGVVGGLVRNAGVVAPGAPGAAGLLSLSGFDQTPGGTLSIEIGGTTQGALYDCLVVSNASTLAGVLSVSFINGFVPSGGQTFTFLRGGPVVGTFASTNLIVPLGMGFDVQYTPTSVVLGVTGSLSSLVWRPTVQADWDLTSSNWFDGAATTGLFVQAAAAVFDDDGAYSNVVNLALPLAPNRVLVNSSSNYTFAGTGYLTGPMLLTKTGTATLVITTTNNFSGGTTIDSGALQLGAGAALGTLGSGAVVDRATLVLDQGDTGALANAISGSGSLIKTGPGKTTLGGSLTYTGPTMVSNGTLRIDQAMSFRYSSVSVEAGGTLEINALGGLDSWTYSFNSSAYSLSGTGTIVKTGAGWFQFDYNGPGTFAGRVIISNGVFGSAMDRGVWTGFRGDVTCVSNALGMGVLDLRSDPMTIDELWGNGEVWNSWNSSAQTLTVGAADGSSVFSGRIRGAGGGGANNPDGNLIAVNKVGSGTLTLAGNNTYGGGTIVAGGVLQVDLIADSVASRIGTAGGSANYLSLINGTLRYTGTGTNSTARYLWIDQPQVGSTLDVSQPTGVLVLSPAGGDRSYPLVKTGPGTLVFNGPLGSGLVTVSNGTLLINGTIGGSIVTIDAGATLGGTGVVQGLVSQNGIVSPGTGIGILTVSNQVSCGGASVTRFELGGTNSYDQLVVSDLHILNGTLEVVTTNGYVPVSGDRFNLITNTALGGLLFGPFPTTSLPALPSGMGWDVQYSASDAVSLVVTGSVVSLTAYEQWAAQIPNPADRGDQNDADNDGYANLLEYSQGSDPTNNANNAKLNLVRTNGMEVIVFNRVNTATDIVYEVQASYAPTNNAEWLGLATNSVGSWGSSTNVNDDNTATIHRVWVSDLVIGTNRSLRLKVTRP